MHPPPSRYSSAKYVLAHSQKPAKYLPGSVGRRSTQSTLESYTPPSPHRGPQALVRALTGRSSYTDSKWHPSECGTQVVVSRWHGMPAGAQCSA